ncbi:MULTISPECIES: hypothetical protein [unclassified Nodularia (in: cyanobacteria)]|uniref:hypothetical protein n=1 Tax=unclassified Nodularia (in: cyanobacteria) TaxID=2656917 RepID=UPI00188130DE|nr:MULTISPECIES: hypothetical protein [unclassified Nodularia (in: cyanobacteria)]MBE9198734.1 hypothetical protein [Nodularia sp. LEGE 06071]MCC2695579.1 hypothetical protein [Nodularia sp. LEGE 04288]
MTQNDGQVLDSFIDNNGNLYLGRPHNEVIDVIELIDKLRKGVENFYQIQGFEIALGRTS